MMTQVMSASQARGNIYKLMDETAASHEPILITGKRNNVVMISQEDWNVIQEMLYINSVPHLKESIIQAMHSNDDEFSETLEW